MGLNDIELDMAEVETANDGVEEGEEDRDRDGDGNGDGNMETGLWRVTEGRECRVISGMEKTAGGR